MGERHGKRPFYRRSVSRAVLYGTKNSTGFISERSIVHGGVYGTKGVQYGTKRGTEEVCRGLIDTLPFRRRRSDGVRRGSRPLQRSRARDLGQHDARRDQRTAVQCRLGRSGRVEFAAYAFGYV